MKLPTIDEVERSVGGRPKVDNPKVRVSFYLSPDEEQNLRITAQAASMSMSSMIRIVVKKHLDSLV